MNTEEKRIRALEFYEDLINQFPGLLNGEDDVNGADLVDYITDSIQHIERKY